MNQTIPLPVSTFNIPLSDNTFPLTQRTPHILDPSDISSAVLQQIQSQQIPTAGESLRRHSQYETSFSLRPLETPALETFQDLSARSSDIDSCTCSLFDPRLPLSSRSSSFDNLLDAPTDSSSSVSLFKPPRKRYHLRSQQFPQLVPPRSSRYNLRSQPQVPSESTLTTS